jgi:predicted Zn-dependent protease
VHRLAPLTLAALLAAACGTPKPSERERAAAPVAQPPPEEVLRERTRALLDEAQALRADGDVEGARARLEEAHQLAPADAGVAVELADLLVFDGREIDRAAALLLGVHDRDARWHLLAAHLSEQRGDDRAAETAYRHALEAAPEATDARLRYALVLERLGRGVEATTELERVRVERPDDPIVRDRLATRYEAAGRLADAEAELTALAEAQPDRAAGWARLARFYERTGRAADARAARAQARGTAGGGRALRPLLPSRR